MNTTGIAVIRETIIRLIFHTRTISVVLLLCDWIYYTSPEDFCKVFSSCFFDQFFNLQSRIPPFKFRQITQKVFYIEKKFTLYI